MASGNRNRNAMLMRNAATWLLENASIPLFIRMNELPHVNASPMKMIQLRTDLLCTAQRYSVGSTQLSVRSAQQVLLLNQS